MNMNETIAPSEQIAAKPWVELALKLGAVLIGMICVCGFLDLGSYLEELGISLSEISVRNSDLLFRGALVVNLIRGSAFGIGSRRCCGGERP